MGVMDNHNGFHGFYFVLFFLGNKKTWTSNVQRNIFRMRQESLTIKKVEHIVRLLHIQLLMKPENTPTFLKIKTVSHMKHAEPIFLYFLETHSCLH